MLKTISIDKTEVYDGAAQKLMAQYHSAPTPANYAVWYHYAMNTPPELVKEMDALMAQNPVLTQELGHSLYRKYMMKPSASKVAEAAAVNTQDVLAQILQVVSDYSGEAAQYNQQLSDHVSQLQDATDGDGSVQKMVQEIIGRVAGLRESGDVFAAKMDSSREQIEKLQQDLDRATKESQYDFLTGIFNRKKLEDSLEEAMEHAKAEEDDLCLLMLDIDHFKRFNDQFGHVLGDEVLKIVAKALTDSVRGNDIVARYGGEEFTVILPGTPLAGAVVVAESIRKRIASRELKRKDTGEIIAQITVSIGAGLFRADSDSGELLIKRADEALYKAKSSGRNRVKKEGE